MKKMNIQVLAMMLLALLFSDAVPAAEINDSKKHEQLWCIKVVWICKPPIDPTPGSPASDKTQPKPASKTTTEKR